MKEENNAPRTLASFARHAFCSCCAQQHARPGSTHASGRRLRLRSDMWRTMTLCRSIAALFITSTTAHSRTPATSALPWRRYAAAPLRTLRAFARWRRATTAWFAWRWTRGGTHLTRRRFVCSAHALLCSMPLLTLRLWVAICLTLTFYSCLLPQIPAFSSAIPSTNIRTVHISPSHTHRRSSPAEFCAVQAPLRTMSLL